MDDDDAMIVAVAVSCALLVKKRKKRMKRKYKTRIINRNRVTAGFYIKYFINMKQNDHVQFFKYTRMSVVVFNKLLMLITPFITKRKLPDGISPEERLAITLHYLSQGCSMQNIAWTYHVGITTVHCIVIETCHAIWLCLNELYLKAPSTTEEWLSIAKGFRDQWNFPNCIGALDGKHITIQAPTKSGSLFFNYKKTFSIVLLASCDANYFFKLIDIGAYGSQSDGGVFRNSVFGNMLEKEILNVPEPSVIPNTNITQPYVLVADEAFPLKNYIMRPYPGRRLSESQRVFNYRLSRARRVIENTFGILVSRWRLLKTTIIADVKNIDTFIKAIVCLHNYVKEENTRVNDDSYCPPGFVDTEIIQGAWRDEIEELSSVGRLSSNRAAKDICEIRNKLKDYFMSSEGSVPWQLQKVREGGCAD